VSGVVRVRHVIRQKIHHPVITRPVGLYDVNQLVQIDRVDEGRAVVPERIDVFEAGVVFDEFALQRRGHEERRHLRLARVNVAQAQRVKGRRR
jgi:hypothetical protein